MQKKSIHIHFICTGNAYRSRLAEAYLKSKQLPNLEVSSSGLEANLNKNGPICWYAARVVHYQGLVNHVSPMWRQTTKKFLNNADIIVFMHADHYDKAKKNLKYKGNKHEIWSIPDLSHLGFTHENRSPAEELGKMHAAEETFKIIKHQVDQLVQKISHGYKA